MVLDQGGGLVAACTPAVTLGGDTRTVTDDGSPTACPTGAAGRRTAAARVARLRPAVEAALPAILARHAPGHALEHAFPMPGGREKALVCAFGWKSPLVLRVYAPTERGRLETAVVSSRLLEGEAPSYRVLAFGDADGPEPFGYTLSEMLWGTDAESLFRANAITHDEVHALALALAGAAAGIHGVRAPGFGDPALPAEPRADRLSAALLEQVEAEVAAAAAAGRAHPAGADAVADLLDPLFDVLDEIGHEGTLTHGRLDLSSLIVRRDEGRYRLVGVTRLGGMRLLDPAWDLAVLEDEVFPFYPVLRDPFDRAYRARRPPGSVDARRIEIYRAVRSLLWRR